MLLTSIKLFLFFMSQAFPLFCTAWASHSCTFKTICSIFICISIGLHGKAQDSTHQSTVISDSITKRPDIELQPTTPLTPQQIKNRTKTIALVNIAGYGATMIGLYQAWYKDYPQSKFHTFNDNAEWKGMDKIGHAYSAYAESKASMEMWRWTGISRNKRILIGGFSGAIYQTTIEVLDGFSSEWGWSWGDFAANMVGSGMLVAQEFAWDEQRIQFKWSFHKKTYNDPVLNERSNKIFGNSSVERFLKDYNGQTYWFSTTLKPFFPNTNLPEWLQISVGTGIEGVFGARSNIAKDDAGNITFDRSSIKRVRQWYLAPDVDLTKIKTNKKGIRLALNMLNVIKFPAPSLEYSNGKFSVNFISF